MKKTLCAAALAAVLGWTGAARADDGVIRIGFITDMSGLSADADGPGGAEAIKMAVADLGGVVAGKKVEVLVADHQNRADVSRRDEIDRYMGEALSHLGGLDVLVNNAGIAGPTAGIGDIAP